MSQKEEFSRSLPLFGEAGQEKICHSRVAVFGIGGVGGAVCEALARAGVGSILLVDGDRVSLSNINRQTVALHSTLGRLKTEVMAERILDVNPDCKVTCHPIFYRPETSEEISLAGCDYVVDAVDDVKAKVALALRCREENLPLISAMGAGKKWDPSLFRVSDLAKTEGCPLAKVMRRELKQVGITHLKVVFSPEPPAEVGGGVPASLPFVPPVMGMLLAGEVLRDLIRAE